MSVDQVGSKDSDQSMIRQLGADAACPLIRLVPRTATKTDDSDMIVTSKCPLIRLVPRTATPRSFRLLVYEIGVR